MQLLGKRHGLCGAAPLLRQRHQRRCAAASASVGGGITTSAAAALVRTPPRRDGGRRRSGRVVTAAAAGGDAAASAAAAPLQREEAGGGSGDALYVRRPLAPGDELRHEQSSVIVLGDVPRGCRVVAGGDVIVLGALEGEATAGCRGDAASIVIAARVGPGATLTVAGRLAPAPPAGRADNLLLRLSGGVAAPPAWAAMPGSPPLRAAGAADGAAQLRRLALQLALVGVGAALVAAPQAVPGLLLSQGAEGIAAALLDCFIFGYILLQGASLLSDGSELLLELVDPGIIGGVVLPLLGALPDSLIVLSAASAPREAAQETVAVGIGTLAGSTVLLLSAAFGLSILVGRCDLEEDQTTGLVRARDKTLTRGWDLFRTGVTVERDVLQGARIMGASVLLYGVVQVPAFLGFSQSPTAALTGAAACFASLVAYLTYSVLSPQLQQRRIDAARRRRFRSMAVKALALRSTDRAYGSLVDPLGKLNLDAARAVFDEFDEDASGAIDSKEVGGLLVGLQLALAGPGGGVDRGQLDAFFREFDADKSREISFEEFVQALSRMVDERLSASAAAAGGGGYAALLDPRRGGAAAALLAELPEDDVAALAGTAAALEAEAPDEAADDLAGDDGAPLSSRDILLRAVAKMGTGVALCAVFADPLVEALSTLSRQTGVPPFFVGFVLTPLASNSSEFVSSLAFAAKRRVKTMSLTLSQVYGAVTLNNTLVLGLFLVVVWRQALPWVYSSEVAVLTASTLAVAALGASRSTLPAWTAVPALGLYPLSLAAVHFLDVYLGWQ